MSEERKEIVKKYSNNDVTIVWKPRTCIHAKKCWKDLIQVFDPRKKPWVNIEGATTERIKEQIDACPSGALAYIDKNEKAAISEEKIKVEALKDGPLLVYGLLSVVNSDGDKEIKDKLTAFCRCGASQSKPYCDGSHVKAEFKG